MGHGGAVGDGPGELRGLFCAAGLADGRVVLSGGLPPDAFGTGAGKVAILDAQGVPVGGFDLQAPALGHVFPTLRGLRADDEFGTYDEIGPDGAWRRRVRVRAPGDAAEDRLIPLSDGRYVLVRGLEAEGTGEEGISVLLLAE